MSEFSIRSDSINVEQIMQQIRSRIREKRGIDYTEEEIHELANVKLERFLDPKNIRSDLLERYRQRSGEAASAPQLTREFDPTSVYRSSRPGVVGRMLYLIRRLLNPILKLFFNPAPLLDSVSEQSRVVRRTAAVVQKRIEMDAEMDALVYEVMNNLVVEMTRLAIDMKNHKMRVESVAARLDFDERRARALEETLLEPPQRSGGAEKDTTEGTGERRRRRRRRGRRRSGNGEGSADAEAPSDVTQAAPDVEPDTPQDTAEATPDVEPDTPQDAARVEPDIEPDTPQDAAPVEPDIEPDAPADASPEDRPLDPDEKS